MTLSSRWPSALGLALGYLADRAFGDPRRGHPVAGFGAAASRLEARCYADRQAAGVMHTGALVGAAIALGAALERLTAALRSYWGATLASYWPRLRALLDGDLLYRAKRLALEGADGLFGDLHPSVSWKDGVLSVDKRVDLDVEPGGRGLLLIPVAFACPKCSVITDPPWQPTLTYTPRAIATLWDADRAPAEGVLDELVGDTRAAIMRALEIPMTTTEVASRLGVTPGAVSQQLAMLRRAGVVDAHRSGRGVYSELTPLGTSLLALLDA